MMYRRSISSHTWQAPTREQKARKGIQAGALADDHSVLKELGCFGRAKGAGTVSAAAAAYLVARHAAQPVQGILRAAFEKGADTDTLAGHDRGADGMLGGCRMATVTVARSPGFRIPPEHRRPNCLGAGRRVPESCRTSCKPSSYLL